MMANLRRIQDAFAADDGVRLVSHTVAPSLDGRAVRAEYARRNGVRSGKWHLLTGDMRVIYDLARHSYFAEKDLGQPRTDDQFLPTETMLLVDGEGRLRGVYDATLPLEAERPIQDIRTLRDSP
jgi:protein SCO1/2